MRKKLLIINCIMLVFIILVYKFSEYILRVNNLTFLKSINTIFGVTFTVLLFSFLIQIIIFIYYFTKRSTIITTSISLIVGGGMVVYLWLGLLSYGFDGQEHFVEKDGKKMVARVNSFMKVYVEYYDYINPLVRGNKIKIEEDYGRGGYDPFESVEKITPKKITYYDDNGDAIKNLTIEK
ncbi:MAG: hypothetical protein KIB43_02115 [Clostridium baratii]|uniref:hypothetical protein n=1 Tax=Clostridium baratii TaxID=1561 RepID=UPI0024323742|nr:hypothetical protein [Clostridium baratii]MBS6005733.1 hypothetical protein [Clostridium baratii]MDU1052799.1 hypothetical protein [Clostridium baratii]MDU4912183.1 hypothetical protein [Clostridium baratii]